VASFTFRTGAVASFFLLFLVMSSPIDSLSLRIWGCE
jgi:hypothetical protein